MDIDFDLNSLALTTESTGNLTTLVSLRPQRIGWEYSRCKSQSMAPAKILGDLAPWACIKIIKCGAMSHHVSGTNCAGYSKKRLDDWIPLMETRVSISVYLIIYRFTVYNCIFIYVHSISGLCGSGLEDTNASICGWNLLLIPATAGHAAPGTLRIKPKSLAAQRPKATCALSNATSFSFCFRACHQS